VNKQDNVAVINVQEVEKFEAFLKLVKNGKIEHWQNIADAIGVHRNTISQWRKHPEAIKATINGINHAIEQMEKVGGRDWKMWREKLEMLGIKGKESPLIAQQFNISEGKEKPLEREKIIETTKEVDNALLLREIQRASKDCKFFIKRFCLTLDEHDSKNPIKKFPDKEYIWDLVDLFLNERLLLVEKSRQMLCTWVMVACHLWWVMFELQRLIKNLYYM